MAANFSDYEKIRDSMTVTVITANTPEEKAAQNYRIWQAQQRMEDIRWREEQRLGFCPDEEARNYNAHL
jgi:hypothetical protein